MIEEARAMSRVLGYTVTVPDVEGKPMGVAYLPGTSEDDIPEAHLAQITNPKAWTDPLGDGGDIGAVEVDETQQEYPQHLEDCTNAQLRAIAERGVDGEPIELGNLRKNADIIELLRSYGIDNEGGE